MAEVAPVKGTVRIKAAIEVADLRTVAQRVPFTVIALRRWPAELEAPQYAIDDTANPRRYVIFSGPVGGRSPWLLIIGAAALSDRSLLDIPKVKGALRKTMVVSGTAVLVQAGHLAREKFEEVVADLSPVGGT